MNKFLTSFLLTVQVFLLSGNVNLYASVDWKNLENPSQIALSSDELASTLHHGDRQNLVFKEAPNESSDSIFDFFIDLAEIEEEEDDKSHSFKRLLAKNPYYTSLFLVQIPGYFFKTRLNQRFTAFERFSPEASCRLHVACQVFRI